jgi:beta-glucosidase
MISEQSGEFTFREANGRLSIMTTLKYSNIIQQMSLAEKIALCSGADFWTTKAFPQYGIPSIRVADGPHGLRRQASKEANQPGQGKSIPATCFPTSSAAACSWDVELLQQMGQAIGEEAQQEGVAVVLGPGVNIKRNPLCGRNFEYYSEDPYLAGQLAEHWIKGVQNNGVGVSLKHFAANNQENSRMQSDSILDERTLREIYLPAFENAVKNARPSSLMCAYNSINGAYCSDNHLLLREILREEWAFTGVMMTDWGAMNERVQAFDAGLDLEMPGGTGYFDPFVQAAIQQGALAEYRIDESVDRLLELILTKTTNHQANFHYDIEAHHQLARQIAAQSAVLLKNDDQILPLKGNPSIAVIGALAKEAKFQGAGSSFINPTRLNNVLDGLDLHHITYDYASGYPLKGEGEEARFAEAVASAQTHKVAIVCVGLTDEYESEGYDRQNLELPPSHNELVKRVAAANPNTIVLLFVGSPVTLPWLADVKAVLNMYLPGQAGGLAAADLLLGDVCPSGKLAESYPLQYTDVPSAGFYETGAKQAQYREGIYVGYRYYDKAQKKVAFPFGFGLSYTQFTYSDLSLSQLHFKEGDELEVSVTLRNSGLVAGAEIVELYVGNPAVEDYRPEKELRGFVKVFLTPGEEKRVALTLDSRAFALFDNSTRAWVLPSGKYTIQIGASCQEIRLQTSVEVEGITHSQAHLPNWYFHPNERVTQADFEQLLRHPISPVKAPQAGEFTMSSSMRDMQGNWLMKRVIHAVKQNIAQEYGGQVDPNDPNYRMSVESSIGAPIKNMVVFSGGQMPARVAEGLVHIANHQFLRGLKTMIFG